MFRLIVRCTTSEVFWRSNLRLLWRSWLALQAERLSSAAYVMFNPISHSISDSRYPKKILTRCPVRWSRWTSTQLRLGYAVRSLLGFGSRVARVLNYASCTLVRDTEGYLAAPSLRDYLIFGLETTSILSYQNCPVSYFAIWAPICLIMIRER